MGVMMVAKQRSVETIERGESSLPQEGLGARSEGLLARARLLPADPASVGRFDRILEQLETSVRIGRFSVVPTALDGGVDFAGTAADGLCLSVERAQIAKEPDVGASVFERLAAAGFEPALREEAGAAVFRVLFLRQEASGFLQWLAVISEAFAADDGTAPIGESAAPLSPRDVPVFVPCFNNHSHCLQMITQLRARGFASITLVDNASTSETMRAFLDRVEADGVTVERLSQNLGPRESIFTPERLEKLPRHFVVTDPDIRFGPRLDADFISIMAGLLDQHDLPKVGLALDISQPHLIKGDQIKMGGTLWSIPEWETRFWRNRIGVTQRGDAVFRARVDTTFALHDRDRFKMKSFFRGLRVAGQFTATHLPWHTSPSMATEEEALYRGSQRHSRYVR